MSRERFCRSCGKWFDADNWPVECLPKSKARSSLPAPMVIADTMDPLKSMLDGKMYTSKRALRETYRAAGVTEVGNEIPDNRGRMYKPMKRPEYGEVRDTVDKAFSQAGLGA